MGRDDAIAADHVWGLLPLLDQLQLGFVLITPDGEVGHVSYQARRLLGRRASMDTLKAVLGEDWTQLVDDVLAGRSNGARWREIEGESESGALQLSVRSTALEHGDGRTGVLVSMLDVSIEIGLHNRYKGAMAKLEQANLDLRRRIAHVLREHEDDLAQFDELLQIAPAIFASFVAEASTALDQVARLAREGEIGADDVDGGLRATHTLKGNSRGLGLHFIAGRAHAVEDLLVHARDRGRLADVQELTGAIGDLRRALERAAALRGRLTAVGAGRTLETARATEAVVARLESVRPSLWGAHPARVAIEDALAVLAPLAQVPLDEIIEYLRVVVRMAAEEAGKPAPEIDSTIGTMTVPPTIHAALAKALPHLVRNAVVHGFEDATERTQLGKAATGRIAISAVHDGERLVIEVRDDGKGIDRQRLRERAVAAGLVVPAATAADQPDPIDQLIFHPGLSTAATVGKDAGRGYGTAAAREAIEALGGALTVRSWPGEGVEVHIVVPIGRRRATT